MMPATNHASAPYAITDTPMTADRRMVALTELAPTILEVALTQGGAAIRFTSAIGRRYQIDYTDLLAGTWQPLAGGTVVGTGQDLTVTDGSGSAATRFYRVGVIE